MKARLLENNVIALDPKATKLIHPGDRFLAIDAIDRTFQYQYLGIQLDACGYDIYLRNESWTDFTNVELEWFNQRKIIVLQENDNTNDNGSGNEENGNETED